MKRPAKTLSERVSVSLDRGIEQCFESDLIWIRSDPKLWAGLGIGKIIPDLLGTSGALDSILTERFVLGRPRDVSSLTIVLVFKGTVPRDFRFQVFFSWISFPQAPEYPVRAFSNFSWWFSEIFAAQGAPPGGKWKKSSFRKVLVLFGHLWIVGLTYRYFFPASSLQGVSSLILSHYLPPVSTTPAVSVLHPDLRISTKICEQIRNYKYYFQGISGRWFMKKPKEKILWHCLFQTLIVSVLVFGSSLCIMCCLLFGSVITVQKLVGQMTLFQGNDVRKFDPVFVLPWSIVVWIFARVPAHIKVMSEGKYVLY